MSTAITAPADIGTKLYLLSIRGTLVPKTIEEARRVHNETAGADASVTASRALGDLSHNVYVRADEQPKAAGGAGEVLFLDVWNSIMGLQQFFSDPQVQQGGAMIFAEKDPVVWTTASNFPCLHLPAPRDKNERVIGLVRGKVHSLDAARETLQTATAKRINASRRLGHLSREYFVRADGADGSTELLGVDVWTSLQGAGEFYSSMEDMGALMRMFAEKPATSVWRQPEGIWTEW